jgi:hypothetical protein
MNRRERAFDPARPARGLTRRGRQVSPQKAGLRRDSKLLWQMLSNYQHERGGQSANSVASFFATATFLRLT